ncbi:MAG TPA: hypothetical protein VGF97_05900 [Rhizomicrobium sp.]|jgi:hypothetical protein
MSGPAIQFRVACYGLHGSIRRKAFDSEHSAKDWARDNIADFSKLVLESRDRDRWSPVTTFTRH